MIEDADLTQEIDVALRDVRLADWIRSCLSKRRYPSQEGAAETARLRGAAARRALRNYYCGHCYGWHLTSRPLR